jgi:diguanylate cyclase (GGDEF)-like protein
MISLKKYIESSVEKSAKALCDSYRASLTAVGISATQICPQIGEDFQRDLLNLRDRLCVEAEAATLAATGKQIEQDLKNWGESASSHLRETARNVKELMLIVAEATQAVGERDLRYALKFGEFAGQLAAIGDLGDIAKIRLSLANSAQQLRSCVEEMVHDGEQSVARLRAEISTYQSRLDEVERIATQDPVTGIANRYKAERQIQARIERGADFSVAIFDLDRFKQVNDIHGHSVGDALLRDVATELRSFFPPNVLVSRWGGDEFLVILDCGAADARNRIEPARRLAEGGYDVALSGEKRQIIVQASVGIASWQPGETAAELVQRADAAMYQEKAQRKKTATETARSKQPTR